MVDSNSARHARIEFNQGIAEYWAQQLSTPESLEQAHRWLLSYLDASGCAVSLRDIMDEADTDEPLASQSANLLERLFDGPRVVIYDAHSGIRQRSGSDVFFWVFAGAVSRAVREGDVEFVFENVEQEKLWNELVRRVRVNRVRLIDPCNHPDSLSTFIRLKTP